MSKDHSEPAFPSNSHEYGPVLGLSIRDFFAAKAIAPIIADMMREGNTDESDAKTAAEVSYAIADAMLKERAK